MINKLAVFYKVHDEGAQMLEDALIDIAPQIRRRLSTATGARVHLERLSTAAVTRDMIAADLTRKRRGAIVDRVAAAYILQGCLDFLGRTA